MAFVTRSPKKCLFFNNNQQPVQDSLHKLQANAQTDPRIHQQCDHQFKRLLKPKSLNKQLQKHAAYSELKTKQLQRQKKLIYNFNLLKKHKLIFRPNQNIPSQRDQDPKQYYELPGCISPKTMVKYVNNCQNTLRKQKQPQCQPGPGAYNPNTICPVKSPKFHTPKSSNLQSIKPTQQEQNERKSEQKLFAVRYKFMNSSSFKKSPNLTKYSNNLLLSKLFNGRKSLESKQTMQNQSEQYTKISQLSPGPGSYSLNCKSKNNSCMFGNEKRFMMNISSGSNNYYQIETQNGSDVQNKNMIFSSQVERFQKQNISYLPLQYTNYQNSLIQESKNRKMIGFVCNSQKLPNITKTDSKPFYDITFPVAAANKFSQVQINRCQFEKNNKDMPGPGYYDVNPNWTKQYGCLILKQGKPTKIINQQDKQNKSSNFCLSSMSKLGQKKEKVKNKKIIQKKMISNSATKMKEQQQQKYYDVFSEWQKKSFNKLFTNEILHSNNPVQSKIL